ncbi:restriction endonuclease subunit S [Methylocystis rosea]|nr:restriction endonuclease subunit S [Methylocystis rosea]
MIDGWKLKPLGDLVRIASGQVDPKDTDVANKFSVGPENLRSGGGLDKLSLRTAGQLEQISGKYEFDKDAILYSKIRPNLNKIALVDFDGICSADMYPIWVRDAQQAVRDFVFYVMNSERFVADATSRSFRTGLPKINRPDLEGIEVFIPPVSQQRKIAEILRTWDETIEKLEVLRALKARRLEAFRDELLFGARGNARRSADWPLRRLGDVTCELTTRNNDMVLARELVMGITNSRGIVPMREQTIADDISRYKLLPPRAFAYNPMRINVGSIAMNGDEQTVLVSPDYVVFACNAGGIEADYLDHIRQTRWWLHHVNSGGTGSVRQRTYYDDLAALHLPLPEPNEQAAIIAVLNSAKAEIAATERMLDVIARQKRGLMQKLLTGEWRVKAEAD